MGGAGAPGAAEALYEQEGGEEGGARVATIFAAAATAAVAAVHLLHAGYLPRAVKRLLPESAAVLLLGVAGGAIVRYTTSVNFVGFNHDVFFHILLPPIILYAGYSLEELHGDVFFSNIRSICTFAILGTFISTVVVSLLSWTAAAGGVVPLSLTECWIFGALISAIDPVSTLSIFESSHVEDELFNVVFGESVLNDAVSIVLFRAASEFAKPDYPATAGNIGKAIGMFFLVSMGSVLIGLGVGALVSIGLKWLRVGADGLATVIFFLFGFLAYSAAEAAHLSGIITILLYGIFLGHYGKRNMSRTDKLVTGNLSHILGWVFEGIVFISVGTSVLADRNHSFNFSFIAIALCACLLGRAANTFPLSAAVNLGRKRKIGTKTQIVMFFAGLRGAIAYALSLDVSTANKDVIKTTTLAIVLVTTVLVGGATLPLLEWMGIVSPDESERGEAPSLAAQGSRARRGVSKMWFLVLDRTYLLPFFVKHGNLPKWLNRHDSDADRLSESEKEDEPEDVQLKVNPTAGG